MATPPSFPALDPDSVYAFEADTANLIHLRAWDELPSASESPWSLFSAELAAFTPSGEEGNLVAEVYRYAETTLVSGTSPCIDTTVKDASPKSRSILAATPTGRPPCTTATIGRVN